LYFSSRQLAFIYYLVEYSSTPEFHPRKVGELSLAMMINPAHTSVHVHRHLMKKRRCCKFPVVLYLWQACMPIVCGISVASVRQCGESNPSERQSQ